MERKQYCYSQRYKAEGVTTEYEIFGEAYFPRRSSTLIRRLPIYEQKEPFGIDKVTISLPRDYLDEFHFWTLRNLGGISKYLFIYHSGNKVYISFQRELFSSSESYLKQVDQQLFNLYSAGIFKFPVYKMSGARGDCVAHFPDLDTPEKQLEALFSNRELEELEVFFDHKTEILKYLRFTEDEVHQIRGTIYSNDYRKSPVRHVNKSFAKVYNKPVSQKAHHVEPTKLEEENPIRIEFTLPKKMMSYMTLNALDCDAGGIIAKVTDAIAKGINEKAPWIRTLSQDPSLNPVLKGILEVEPKKRLRCSRDFVASLQRKVQGGILTYISKQIKEDRLVKDDWDTFIEHVTNFV